MATKRKASRAAEKSMTRTSVGFPPDLYRTLEQIAEQQKVSVGWIVRDAAEKYVADRWPLLAPRA
jgi:metal-responsive CopG/Arc/MetJ family transcriptional regulator